MPNVSTSPIHVSLGHSFSLSLEANPSTGYQWLLSNPLDAKFLELVSTHYTPASSLTPNRPKWSADLYFSAIAYSRYLYRIEVLSLLG